MDHGCLARVQFAFTVGFHIVFPAFSIGLAAYLMLLEGLWLRTRRQVYIDVQYRFWSVCLSSGWVTRKPLMREQEGLSPCQR